MTIKFCRAMLWTCVLLAVVLSTSSASDADSQRVEHGFSGRYIQNGFKDLGHVVAAPFHWNPRQWRTAGLLSGGIVASSLLLDKNIRDLSQRNRNHSTDDVARVMNSLGREGVFTTEALFYAYGELFRDQRAKACGLDGLAASLITAGALTQSIKLVVGRDRPFANSGPFFFRPFTMHGSFPSGHTANSFALAAVVTSHYHKTWVQVTAYSLATLVAYARVDYDAHFTSDILAGGALGFVVGKSVVALNKKLRKI